jgi:cysteine desulfurase family protein (TIGR01976 family)
VRARDGLGREQFPALRRVHNGHPVAYFDGPGGTQVPRAVADAVADYLLHHNATARWATPTSRETDRVIDAARRATADLLGAEPSEVAFGQNMTTLAFHLARVLGRRLPAGPGEGRPVEPGDEIVVSELDHHANVAPWQALADERGAVLRTARLVPETGALDWAHLASLLGPRTRLVAVNAACNALGTLTDVGRAAGLARHVGALVFVDLVHAAPHALYDVRALARAGVDFVSCSPYKFYGPHAGVLWGRAELLAVLDVPRVGSSPDTVPERVETGTRNHEALAGTAAAVDFLAGLGGAIDGAPDGGPRRPRLERAYARIRAHEGALAERMWDGLGAVDGVTLYGPPPGVPRTPTVSFTVRGRTPRAVTAAAAQEGVFLSHGDFYAATVAERYGVRAGGGFVRAGAACYTTADEVDRLVAAVGRAARGA